MPKKKDYPQGREEAQQKIVALENSLRTFFGKPLTQFALEYHPYRERISVFVKEMHEALDGFERNMELFDAKKWKKYREEWVEMFLAWAEIEGEK